MNRKTSFLMLLFLVTGLALTYIIPAVLENNKSTESVPNPQQIRTLMQEQAEAWNKGSLEDFMGLYIKSDSLFFMSTRNQYFGWQTLFDSYNKNYWLSDKRGQLNFEVDTILVLDNSQSLCLVPGKWKVTREDTTLSGKFSLLFKHENTQGWKIIVDHTW